MTRSAHYFPLLPLSPWVRRLRLHPWLRYFRLVLTFPHSQSLRLIPWARKFLRNPLLP